MLLRISKMNNDVEHLVVWLEAGSTDFSKIRVSQKIQLALVRKALNGVRGAVRDPGVEL
jgi:hypothetical protein